MAKAKEYRVITSDVLNAFNSQINELIQNGWSLRGELIVTVVHTTFSTDDYGGTGNRMITTFSREMVLYKKENEKIQTGTPN